MRSIALLVGTLCAIGTVSANWAGLNQYCTYISKQCRNPGNRTPHEHAFDAGDAYQSCLCSAWIQQGHGRCREGCFKDLLPAYNDRPKVVGMCEEYCYHKDSCNAWPKDCGPPPA
ncbi:unnamed protein product [Tilletia caries]|uniref:Uncharacterized protein n=2 Tax=Tilletia TaxID=13289 RepID=A0A8X7MXL6_9BASI|nr:hypothetical protein CF328_g5319 [Tilletia controversa]KAE8253122.1 hypothetical protein A4X03_0g5980 [Tilletia caries]KAE8252965.1 hypothetical protein A4X06_0g1799 [Tilletia controversa]CAD6888313.1 unnamed protein product [Tilletia caries]CAD6948978.1 unnamed protein product [Tilletia caries]